MNQPRHTVGALLAAGLLLAAGCGDSLEIKNTDPRGSVGGLLVDAVTRQPIEGASVSVIAGAKTRGPDVTGADGTFALTKVPAGDVIVMVDGPEGSAYQSAWINAVLDDTAGEFPAANTVTLGPIGLVPATDSYELRVFDARGQPVSGYEVGLRHFVQYVDFSGGTSVNRGEVVLSAVTDGGGRARFDGIPPLYRLSASINATGLLNLPPLATGDGAFDYPGGAQTVSLRGFGDASPDVFLDPQYAATLAVRGSTIVDLFDPAGSRGTATVLAPDSRVQVTFNLPVRADARVLVGDEWGRPVPNPPLVTVDGEVMTLDFSSGPLAAGGEYNVSIHAVAAVGVADVAADIAGSFFTPGLSDAVTVAAVSRNPGNQVVTVEFSEPVGIGGGSGITLNGGSCVMFIDFDLNGSGARGDWTNERGNGGCNIALTAIEPDPEGPAVRSGYTKYWQFVAPRQADGATPLPAGTRFDMVFSRINNPGLIIERADGTPLADFVAPNDVPINP